MCVCRHEHSALYSEGPLEWHWWSLEHLWPCVSHPVPAAQGTQLGQWEAVDMTGLQANGTQGCWKPEGSQQNSFIPVVNNFMTSAHSLTPSVSDWSLEPETEFTLAWKGERKFASLWQLPKTCGELSQPASTGGDYYCDPEIKDGVKESWWRSERGEVMDKEQEFKGSFWTFYSSTVNRQNPNAEENVYVYLVHRETIHNRPGGWRTIQIIYDEVDWK